MSEVDRSMVVKPGSAADVVAVAALADLAIECIDAHPEREADLLRAGAALVAACADLSRGTGDAFAAAVRCGACESAALRLIPPGGSYMMSRSPAGSCIATVKVPTSEEVTLEAPTAGLVVLACIATALARKNQATVQFDTRPSALN